MSPLIKKIMFFIGIILVLIIGMIFAVIWHGFVRAPIYEENKSASIILPPGAGVDHLAQELHQRGLIDHPYFFIVLAKVTGDTSRLKAGEYEITAGMTPVDLLNNIALGKVLQRSFTLVEGRTFAQLKKTLNDNPHLKHHITGLTDADIMQQMGGSGHPEGQFFPATYSYTWGDDDLMILKEAYAQMQKVLNTEWQQRATDLPYRNAYEALIVASLIEKETALPQERAQVSGVIVRRLQKRMKLQIDPTILYGLGLPYSTPITRAILAMDTPYNTYRHYGLPPTPINMPSRASILAALHPESGVALFYVSKGDGGHVFSATYEKHKQAISHLGSHRHSRNIIELMMQLLFPWDTLQKNMSCRVEIPTALPKSCR